MCAKLGQQTNQGEVSVGDGYFLTKRISAKQHHPHVGPFSAREQFDA